MTATIETPVVLTAEQDRAIDRITDAVNALSNLADLVRARPDIADSITLKAWDINVFVGEHLGEGEDVPERIASLATAAAEHGAVVSQRHQGEYGGIEAMFGPFPLHVYARIGQVGTTVSRTVEVVDWQPHPALAVFATGDPR